jgi:hypothetical protein
MQMFQIGEICELMQTEPPKAKALEAHKNRAGMQRVREAQGKLAALRPGLNEPLNGSERAARLVAARRIIKAEIGPVLNEKGARLVIRARAKTRDEIIKLVAKHCASNGMRGVTSRRVEACWKKFRADALISARVSEGGRD